MDQSSRVTPQSITNYSINWLYVGLVAAFMITAAVTAFLTFVAVRNTVLSRGLIDISGVTLDSSSPAQPEQIVGLDELARTPLQPPAGPSPQPWDGISRVNILVLGLDYREWDPTAGTPRSDLMMVLSLDPISQTAALLSIPPDLWVTIPGFGHDRINYAYSLGEINPVPGGGPQLAMKTVEGLLGLDIQYYLQIDFTTFERFIDEIGGVKLDVIESLKIDPLGDKPPRVIQPGVQVLPADLALAYARVGGTKGGSFDRAPRQQQVVMAIRNRLLHHDTLVALISQAPRLYYELSKGFQTNLTLEQIIQLSWFGVQVPEGNIKLDAIGPDQAAVVMTPDEQEVLKPIPMEIRILRDELFTAYGAVNPATTGDDNTALMQAEAANVAVFNGTATPGLASTTTVELKAMGIKVTQTGNASQISDRTTVTDHTGNPHTIRYLVDVVGIPADQVFHDFQPYSEVDIVIILGNDWGTNTQ
jgi:LCP family protein required for cell wall assembly